MRGHRFLLAVLLLPIILHSQAHAEALSKVLYLSAANGSDTTICGGASNPCASLQFALTQAKLQKSVFLQLSPGTYNVDCHFNNITHSSAAVFVDNSFVLEEVRGVPGETIVRCSSTSAGPLLHIRKSLRLYGLTFRGVNKNSGQVGGALLWTCFDNTSSTAVGVDYVASNSTSLLPLRPADSDCAFISIESCAFLENSACAGGALAIMIAQTLPVATSIINCTFAGNRATHGCIPRSPLLKNSTTDVSLAGLGGAVLIVIQPGQQEYDGPSSVRTAGSRLIRGHSISTTNSVFTNNAALTNGGAVYIGTASLFNLSSGFYEKTNNNAAYSSFSIVAATVQSTACTYVANRAAQGNGGAVMVLLSTNNGTVNNCTHTMKNAKFIGNTAGAIGGSILVSFQSGSDRDTTNCTSTISSSSFQDSTMFCASVMFGVNVGLTGNVAGCSSFVDSSSFENCSAKPQSITEANTAFTFGGALQVSFVAQSGQTSNCNSTLSTTRFLRNQNYGPLLGGGAYSALFGPLQGDGETIGCASMIGSSYFGSNQAGGLHGFGGGALVIFGAILSGSGPVEACTGVLMNSTFESNGATGAGGGVATFYGSLFPQVASSSILCVDLVVDCNFTGNNAPEGAGLYLTIGSGKGNAISCASQVLSSIFLLNNAEGGSSSGGGAYIMLGSRSTGSTINCSSEVSHVTFKGNTVQRLGGGLHVGFSSKVNGDTRKCTSIVRNCIFEQNLAKSADATSAAGASIIMGQAGGEDGSRSTGFGDIVDSTVLVTGSTFAGNIAKSTTNGFGAGLDVTFGQPIGVGNIINCSATVLHSLFRNNKAAVGGACSFSGGTRGVDADITNLQFLIKNCEFIQNVARGYGGAIQTSPATTFSHTSTGEATGSTVAIENCVFDSNSALLRFGGALAVVNLRISPGSIPGSPLNEKDYAPALFLTNNTFRNNSAVIGAGGAIALICNGVLNDEGMVNATVLLTGNTFSGNVAVIGGAIALLLAGANGFDLMSQGNTWTENIAHLAGGAVCISTPTLQIQLYQNITAPIIYTFDTSAHFAFRDDIFFNNSAPFGGAIMLNGTVFSIQSNTVLDFENCTFQENNAAFFGGATHLLGPYNTSTISQQVFANFHSCRFNRNNAATYGGGLYVSNSVAVRFLGTILTGNYATSGGSVMWVSGGNTATVYFEGTEIHAQSQVGEDNIDQLSQFQQLAIFETTSVKFLSDSSSFFCYASTVLAHPLLPLTTFLEVPVISISVGVTNPDNVAEQLSTTMNLTTSLRQFSQWDVSCLPCPSGFYSLRSCPSRLATKNDSTSFQDVAPINECKRCPEEGAECLGGFQVNSMENYWFCNNDCTADMYECPEGYCGENNECTSGRDEATGNPLCGRCLPGYSKVGQGCQVCDFNSKLENWVFVVTGSFVYVFVLLYVATSSSTPKKKIFMYFVQTLTLVLGPMSSWATWTGVFKLSITKYVCLGQTSGESVIITNLATPFLYFAFALVFFVIAMLWRAARRVFSCHRGSASLLATENKAVSRFDESNDNKLLGLGDTASDMHVRLIDNRTVDEELSCDYHHDRHDAKQSDHPMDNVSNWHTLATSGGHGGGDHNHGGGSDSAGHGHADGPSREELEASKYTRLFHVLLLFSYETLSEQALQLMNCVDLGTCGSVLAETPDVSCYSSTYSWLHGIAIGILIFAVVFPVALLAFLIRAHFLNQLYKPAHAARYGVFYSHYKPEVYWWQFQELLRRFMAVFLYVHYFLDVQFRSYTIGVVNLVSCIMHLVCQPFEHRLDNLLESVSLSVLLFASMSKIAQQSSGNTAEHQNALTLSLTSVLSSVLALIGGIFIIELVYDRAKNIITKCCGSGSNRSHAGACRIIFESIVEAARK